MDSKDKVLVTGATGFVGRRLCCSLDSSNFDVVGVGRSNIGRLPHSISYQCRDLETSTIKDLVTCDLSCIIHAAGRAHFRGGDVSSQLELFRRANVEASVKLARLAVEARVKRFVFISSIGVYGSESKEFPLSERSPFNAVSPYAVSKLEAERELISLFESTPHSELTIVRPPLIYDVDAPGNFGRLLRLAFSDLPLPFGLCSNRRNIIALRSFVEFLVACVRDPRAGNQSFVVSDTSPLSTADMLGSLRRGMKRSERLFPVPPSLMSVGLRLIGRADMYDQLFNDFEIDNRKAKTVVGWTPCDNSSLELERVGLCYADNNAQNRRFR